MLKKITMKRRLIKYRLNGVQLSKYNIFTNIGCVFEHADDKRIVASATLLVLGLINGILANT
jgi:hypothetical protein